MPAVNNNNPNFQASRRRSSSSSVSFAMRARLSAPSTRYDTESFSIRPSKTERVRDIMYSVAARVYSR
ncbi:hypothetical protein EC988_006787 [Linderina pennispora]|nr:hypothetical protein EC988_006787 [Linderina pennispora]